MLLHTASHLYAQTIAEGDFRADWEQLLERSWTPLIRPFASRGTLYGPLAGRRPRSGNFGRSAGVEEWRCFRLTRGAFNGLLDRTTAKTRLG